MKKSMVFALVISMATMAFKAATSKLVSNEASINFFSHTAVEDISSNNYKVVSTLDQQTGEVVFSVPMQSFEFEKELMQKHFNSSDFLNTKKYPKSKFTGKITNLKEINFAKDGTYTANVSGEMTIKDVTKPLKTNGTITITNGEVKLNSKMNLVLSDYNITFKKGKPSTNIAKEVTITTIANYLPQ